MSAESEIEGQDLFPIDLDEKPLVLGRSKEKGSIYWMHTIPDLVEEATNDTNKKGVSDMPVLDENENKTAREWSRQTHPRNYHLDEFQPNEMPNVIPTPEQQEAIRTENERFRPHIELSKELKKFSKVRKKEKAKEQLHLEHMDNKMDELGNILNHQKAPEKPLAASYKQRRLDEWRERVNYAAEQDKERQHESSTQQSARMREESLTKQITPEDSNGIPNTVIHDLGEPPRRVWEIRKEVGKRWYRDPEQADAEMDWYEQQRQRLQYAKDTGRFELIGDHDSLTQSDILEIAKTAAEHYIARLETQKTDERSGLVALQQARQETGQIGHFRDPDMTLDYANRIMDIKHKRELHEYEKKLEAEHLSHQRLLDNRLEALDSQIQSRSEHDGLFSRLRKTLKRVS